VTVVSCQCLHKHAHSTGGATGTRCSCRRRVYISEIYLCCPGTSWCLQSIKGKFLEMFSNSSLCGPYRNLVRYSCPKCRIDLTMRALVTNYFAGSKPQTSVPSLEKPGDVPAVDPRMLPPVNLQLAWDLDQRLDMHVHLSTSPNGDVFSNQWTSGWRGDHDKGLPNFVWENLTFGNWKDSRTFETDIKFPEVSICSMCVALLTFEIWLIERFTKWFAVGGYFSHQGRRKSQSARP
jgi:hypothetical protein